MIRSFTSEDWEYIDGGFARMLFTWYGYNYPTVNQLQAEIKRLIKEFGKSTREEFMAELREYTKSMYLRVNMKPLTKEEEESLHWLARKEYTNQYMREKYGYMDLDEK